MFKQVTYNTYIGKGKLNIIKDGKSVEGTTKIGEITYPVVILDKNRDNLKWPDYYLIGLYISPTEEDPAANEENPAPTENPATSGINTVEASQELINILLGRNDPQVTNKTLLTQKAAEMSDEDIDNVDFEDLQEMLLAFVRDVNWKTGLKITYRDLTWFNRLKMACRGINQMTKPVRANFEAYIGDISSSLDQASDAIVDHLATSSRGRSFDSMARLSVVGLVNAIDTKNPFLLMLVDHETYNQLVSIDPKIAQLYQDMFTFFKIRAVRMTGADYDKNTKELIRVSKLGEGNYIATWHAMAEGAGPQRFIKSAR